MDITRWKSVAVKKSVHEAILALCGKYMGPGTYIEKLVDDAIEYEADKDGITADQWRRKHVKTKEIKVKKRKRS